MNIKELITKIIKDFEDFKEGNKAVVINEKTSAQEFGNLKPLLNEKTAKVFEEILNLRNNGMKQCYYLFHTIQKAACSLLNQ